MAMYSLSTALSLLALLSLAQCEVTPQLNADSLNSTLDLTVVNVHPHSVELSWQVDTQVSGRQCFIDTQRAMVSLDDGPIRGFFTLQTESENYRLYLLSSMCRNDRRYSL